MTIIMPCIQVFFYNQEYKQELVILSKDLLLVLMEQEIQDLEPVNIESMLKGLSTLTQEPVKPKDDTYQQYQRAKVQAVKPNFMKSLQYFYQKGSQTKLLNNIVKNHNKYFSCLLAYCQQIEQVIEESDLFSFSHKGFVSQSALLAFFLAKRTGAKVSLAASDDSLLRMGHLIAGEAEEDKLSFTKSALQKEDIALHSLGEWRKGGLMAAENETLIVDVFGLSPIEYSPLLLRSAGQWKGKVFIYHSHLQDGEVADLLGKAGRTALPLRLWGDHPTEAQLEKDESKLLQSLIDFLAEDRAHPEKQDVVIFFPVETHPKRFAARLAEQLSKAGLRDHVAVVTKPHQPQLRSKNNIFIVEGTQQLLTWNYDYSNVLYVVDYGRQSHLTFNYQACSYQQILTAVSPHERALRYSLVGDNHFGIYLSLAEPVLHRNNFLDRAKDISIYLLKMIDYGLQEHLDYSHQRAIHGLALLERLKVIKRDASSYVIADQQAYAYAKLGISPIQSAFILSIIRNKSNEKECDKYANLAIFMAVCLHTKESLRKQKHEEAVFMRSKPTELWRKGGYIESCLALIAECESTQLYLAREGESESFRRNSSKMEESETDPFGSFYQLIQNASGGLEGEKLSIPNFLQENSIDEDIFYRLREEIDHYRDIFGIPKTSIIFDKDYFGNVLRSYVELFKNSLLFYSGFIRKGYCSDNKGYFKDEYLQINSEQLKKYCVKPHFISAMRYQIKEGIREITHWNTVQQLLYIEAMGGLPIMEKLSKHEAEIQFHGISTLLFEKLWRNNGSQIFKFEEQNQCFVEANNEMALIIVHCDKDKESDVKGKFENIINKIKSGISASNKLTNYFANIKFYVGAGGVVKEMVIGDYVTKGLVEGLHLDATKEDLQELIEEFLVVRDINMRLPVPGQITKSAIVFFNSQRDYYRFYEYFNDCQYCGFTLKVTPIRSSKSEFAWQRQYIQFKWYIWQSHNKGLVRFANQDAAKKAAQTFADNPTIDGNKVSIKVDGKSLYIDELNDLTDETFIEEAFKDFGSIQEVDILKTPLRDGATDALELQNLVIGAATSKQFTMEKIERGKNGLRTCRVLFENYQELMKVVAVNNKSVGRLGVSRLYTFPHFERSMQISDSLRNVAAAILGELIDEYEGLNLIQRKLIRHEFIGEQIIFYSPDKKVLDNFYTTLSTRMRGSPIKLKKGEKNLLFNEIGLANLMDLEEKYNCKLVINVATQSLTTICRMKLINALGIQISSRISNSFFYKIYLNSKIYRHFKSHPEILTQVRNKYKLKLVELEADQQTIIIEGGIVAVQTANVYFMFLVESLTQPEESRVHSDVCGICCQQPKNSYRLQSCFHRFCIQCVQSYIKSVLGDASQFPIKCPHCSQLVIVEDLQLILDKTQWQKVDTLGINRFMSDNSDKMAFCFTAGCKQINFYNGPVFSCVTCKFSYCNKCREIVHPGYNCDQAIQIRQTDAYFLKYMAENGIRKCPNGNCGMPVVKIDGCNKVLCTRCGKSMCFKCPVDQMIAYDTPQEAYDHLNAKHGGYW